MKKLFEEEWCCLQCGQCKHFKVDADRTVSTCKRIDHKHIKFAFPYFKSYDCGQFSPFVCKDFEPSDTCPWLKEHWKGWNDYWEGEEPSGTIGFILNDQGNLKWIEKEYYKQSRKSPIGYVLIHEKRQQE